MRILITGGAGFIGSNLARLAVNEGHEVTVIDDLSTGRQSNLDGLDIRILRGSINDKRSLSDALEGVQSVVHLAAIPSVPRSVADPVSSHNANATGTLSLLEASRDSEVEHVSVASSSSVYGANPAIPKTEREWVRPMSPYAVSKLATEQYALAYNDSYGLPTMAFRFFNVYGPGQPADHDYAAVIPAFVDALLSGKSLPLNGDGSQSRDFTFVGSVCRILLDTAVERKSHNEPVNLAFGTRTTLLELIERLERISGTQAQIEYRAERVGDVKHSQADNSELRRLFPHLNPVSLDEGLKATIDWFRDSVRRGQSDVRLKGSESNIG